MNTYVNIPGVGAISWKSPVDLVGDLPSNGNTLGDARVVTSSGGIYVWDGAVWNIPVSGAGAWGTITGTLSNQTDLQDALNTKANLNSYNGVEQTPSYSPNGLSQQTSVVNENINVTPLQNSPDESVVANSIFAQLDPTNTGYDIGSNGVALIGNDTYIKAVSTGDLGDIGLNRLNFEIGDGTNPLSVRGLSYSYGFGQVRDNVTITNNIQGYGFQPNLSSNVTVDNAYTTAFYDNANIQTTSGGHTSFNSSPNIDAVGNNKNFNGVTVSPNISEFQGNAGATGIGVFGNWGPFGTGGFQGINVNPIVTGASNATGLNVNMDNVSVTPGSPSILVIQDLTITASQTGSVGNTVTFEYTNTGTAGSEVVTGSFPTYSVAIQSGVSTATQIKAALDSYGPLATLVITTVSGVGSNPQVTQAATNMSGGVDAGYKKAGYFKGDVQIDGALQFSGALSIGSLSSYAPYTIVDGMGTPESIDTLITNPSIGNNLTVNNVDVLAINTASLINIGVNSTVNTGFLGIAALGLPAVLSMQTGSNIGLVSGATFALSLDANGTGGTADEVVLCRALSIPNGVTTVNKLYGYKFDLPFGNPGTKTFGFYSSPTVPNYFAGGHKIGGTEDLTNTDVALELGDPKAFLPGRATSIQIAAITPVTGMVMYNTDINKLVVYDGSAWITTNYNYPQYNAGNSGTSLNLDFSNGPAQLTTLTGNVTLTLSNPESGSTYVIKIDSGAGGFIVTWPANVKWPGGTAPVITTAPSAIDLINLYYDGVNYLGSFAQDIR